LSDLPNFIILEYAWLYAMKPNHRMPITHCSVPRTLPEET
jgi:hypothetical protein